MASKETWIHGAPMRYSKMHLFLAGNVQAQPVFFGRKCAQSARQFWREAPAYASMLAENMMFGSNFCCSA